MASTTQSIVFCYDNTGKPKHTCYDSLGKPNHAWVSIKVPSQTSIFKSWTLSICKLKSYNGLVSLFVWALYPLPLYLYCIPFAVIHNRFSFAIPGQNVYNSVFKTQTLHFRKCVSNIQHLELRLYCWFRLFSPRPHKFLRDVFGLIF